MRLSERATSAAVGLLLLGMAGLRAEEPENGELMKTQNFPGLVVQMHEPVVVALSAPGEKRWGYHQFPTISRLPDGQLLVTFNDRADRDGAYGTPGPAYRSADGGLTWQKWTPPDPLLSISHSVISEVNDGEFLCVPMAPSLDIRKNKVTLPAVAGTMDVYGTLQLYRLKDCPSSVEKYVGILPATRWSPGKGAWVGEEVVWDTKDALVRTREADYVITKAYIDNRIVRLDGDLYYPDFHLQYLLPAGAFPKKYACWCMVSKDNGHTWQRQGLIAHDDSGDLMMGEPCLLPTADGKLACIIRCTDQRQRPMLVAYSEDKGRTWSATRPLHDFGVMPQALLLENGVAVVSFGRPGVHLMFSADGKAREWVGPLTLIPGSSKKTNEHSCGYTRLLPLSAGTFLIAYSDFKYPGEDGKTRKAILVRKIAVTKGPGSTDRSL